MLRSGLVSIFLLLLAASRAGAHAPPTPLAAPPLRVQSNHIVDAKGAPVLLRGASLPMVESADPPALAFRVILQRWNMNAVRVPASVPLWKSTGQPYLDRLAAIVASATSEGLVVILTAREDGAALPDAATLDFWRAAAAQFKNTPGVIFSLFNEPAPRALGGDRGALWRAWDSAMQPLVDAIRAAGATQIVAAPAIQDGLDFQGFGRDFFLRDANVIYEVHPAYAADDARDRNFGSLVNDLPIFAGAWGGVGGGCAASSDDATAALSYFDRRNISWTVSEFGPGSLLVSYSDFAVAEQCSAGPAVLDWMTEDEFGFGSIDASEIASAAGGAPGPVAPGEIISIYGQLIGPQDPLGPHLTGGLVDTTLGGVQAFFDGAPAPILLASYFQANVQVPYELAGRKTTVLQMVYRGVPSNKVTMQIADTAPGIFTTFTGGSDALALNQDGTINGPGNPAPRGSVVALFATGAGQTSPASATGAPASPPFAALAAAVVTIGGRSSDILYAGPAPTLVGVTQVNARVPADLPAGRASVSLTVGNASSRTGVVFWVQ